MSIINSINNFRVQKWSKLKVKQYRDKEKCFIAEGYHNALEAFKSNCLIEVVSTEKNAPFDVPHHTVTYEVMEKLTAMATPPKLLGICRFPKVRAVGDTLLLIDQVHHPGNLGTIIRSAVAFGVDTVVLNASVDAYNTKVVQASQGMIFHINIVKKPLQAFLLELKSMGYQLVGTDVREGIPVQDFRAAQKRAVLIGGEGDGVGDDLHALCDVKVNIPMDARCESLNVGVATSIVLYALAQVRG